MNRIIFFIAIVALMLPPHAALARDDGLREFAGDAFATVRSTRPVIVGAQGTIEVAFSPHGGVTDAIVRLIGEAKSSIRMASYSLTSNPIGKALVEARHRGVDVQLVIDKDHNGRRESRNSVASYLAANGIPVRVDYTVAIQHQKTIVVDGISVLNGSANFSAAAEKSNRENITIHRNNPDLATSFLKNWNSMWAESKPLNPAY